MVSEYKTSHWLDYLANETQVPNILKFGPEDIHPLGKPSEEHIKTIVEKHFGNRSLKLKDKSFLKKVFEKHEEIRMKVQNESIPLILDLFLGLATIVGLKASGGGKFNFKNISDEVATLWTMEAWIKTFFVLRSAWDLSYTWILKAEEKVMGELGYEYDGFVSSLKKQGFFAKILSRTKTRKLREANGNLARNCGFKITISTKKQHKYRNMHTFDLQNNIVRDDNYATLRKKEKIVVSKELQDKMINDEHIDMLSCAGIVFASNAFDLSQQLLLGYQDIKKEHEHQQEIKKEAIQDKFKEEKDEKDEKHETSDNTSSGDKEEDFSSDEDHGLSDYEKFVEFQKKLKSTKSFKKGKQKRKKLRPSTVRKTQKTMTKDDLDYDTDPSVLSVKEGSQDYWKSRNGKRMTVQTANVAAVKIMGEMKDKLIEAQNEKKQKENEAEIKKVHTYCYHISTIVIC